jgi:hypothetical protein
MHRYKIKDDRFLEGFKFFTSKLNYKDIFINKDGMFSVCKHNTDNSIIHLTYVTNDKYKVINDFFKMIKKYYNIDKDIFISKLKSPIIQL